MRLLAILLAVAVITIASLACRSTADLTLHDSTAPAHGVPVSVAIQPFTGVTADEIEAVRDGIMQLYGVDVVVLPERDLPERAYFEPRNRYRAPVLLEELESMGPETTKVLGVTPADIPDWGIFGYGSVGGRTCIVSGFRLRRGGVNLAQYLERLQKVANHEVGHTFGLRHCDQTRCLMQDAGGMLRTVDEVSSRPCERCWQALRLAGLAMLS
ncbi:MAG TPA: hypothetical protein VJV05_11685 [Pyrinomonadaceae bacterium]|nr:hypothetical protein [Pyrinomonadaceae bacterium]